ncbi:MAG: SDR family NAD(P)-dependent oxidoreductase [Halieaceae bacterium]|nr:SDR family NAD(P)-dependent oxidoreductase [Halieaceae bacterium]
MTDIAVVVGVGAINGLGAAIAKRFAREKYTVIVAGRTSEKVDPVAENIAAAGGKCISKRTDASSEKDISELFELASSKGKVKATIFNVGNNQIIDFSDLTAEILETFWRSNVLSGFLTAKAALPLLEKQGGSLLFTGASASIRGKPKFAHFGSAKAGLRNLAQSLAKEFGPRGVHIGHIIVDGVINGELAKTRFRDYLESLGESGSLEPDAIADSYWFLHTQPQNAWTFELDVRPYKEPW